MKELRAEKLKKLFIETIMVTMIVSLSCFAQNTAFEDRKVFLEVNEEERNEIREYVKEYYDETQELRQDFIYLGDDYLMHNENQADTVVVSEVYDSEIDLSQDDILIGNFCFDSSYEKEITFTFRYYADGKDAVPHFINASGEKIELPEDVSVFLSLSANNYHVYRLSLLWEQLSGISYFEDGSAGEWVLQPVSDESMVISSISIGSEADSYSSVKKMTGSTICEIPAAKVTYEITDDASHDLTYQIADGCINIGTESLSEVSAEAVSRPCNVGTEISSVIPALVFISAEQESDETFKDYSEETEAKLLIDEDLPEKAYIGLEEGEASEVYTDSWLFADSGSGIRSYFSTCLLRMNYYANIFGLRGYVALDNISQIEEMNISVGESFDSSAYPVDTAVIKIAGNTSDDYAGEMKIRLQGQMDVAERKFVRKASPSDAVREEQEDPEVSEEYEEESEAPETPEGSPEEQTETGIYIDVAAIGRAGTVTERQIAFAKPDGSVFCSETGVTVLSEAFLKKASYCALDECGTIAALFNSHGRCIELLEGYGEEDITSYILMPVYEICHDDVSELDFAEISFTYNNVLAYSGEFGSVEYIGEDGNQAVKDMDIYTEIDVETYIDLTLWNYEEADCFYVSADAVEAEVLTQAYNGFDLDFRGEADTRYDCDIIDNLDSEFEAVTYDGPAANEEEESFSEAPDPDEENTSGEQQKLNQDTEYAEEDEHCSGSETEETGTEFDAAEVTDSEKTEAVYEEQDLAEGEEQLEPADEDSDNTESYQPVSDDTGPDNTEPEDTGQEDTGQEDTGQEDTGPESYEQLTEPETVQPTITEGPPVLQTA